MSIIGVSSFALDGITDQSDDGGELFHFRDIDPGKMLWRVINHKKLNTDISSSVIDATIEDDIASTPNIKLTIRDPEWELLESGALTKAIEMPVGKRWYRLLEVEVDDDIVTCTFVIRNAIYLMHHNRKRKANRKNTTRAEFILMLVRAVKKVKIPFYCKQLHKKQKIEPARLDKDGTRQRGLPSAKDAKLTVKGAPADSAQRRNISAVIEVGDNMDGPRRALVGAVMTIIQESTARRSATAGQFVGLFQQSSRYGWPATRDPYKDAPAFYKQFIPIVKANPNSDLGVLITKVQRPLHPDEYALGANRWRAEAENAVDQFVGGGGIKSTEYFKRYDYETIKNADGTNENYLAAIYRLAEEVNWRAFWRGNLLHLESEEDLFKSKSRLRIERDDCEGVRFTLNEQREANEMTLTIRMDRWVAPIGTVVTFGPPKGTKQIAGAKVRDNPANGRWLVTNITKPAFNDLGTITLRKPIEEKLEPAPEIGTRQVDDGSGGSIGALGGSVGGPYVIDDSEGARSVVESLALIAGCPTPGVSGTHAGVHVVSDYRAGSTTTSGNTSDHSGNDENRAARDIGYDSVNALTGPPPKALDRAMVRIAEALDRKYTPGQTVIWTMSNWKSTGIRIQVIWRTPLYGGHMGHIHVGARNEVPPEYRSNG